MNNRIEKTMILYGEDSVKFAETLFTPTAEQKRKNIELFHNLNEGISIKKTKNGYSIEIDDLDLSFLDDSKMI